MALAWVARAAPAVCGSARLCRVVCRTDPMLTKHVAQGLALVANHAPLQQSTVASLLALSRVAKVELTHVKAHAGHPWNELVDSLAFLECARPGPLQESQRCLPSYSPASLRSSSATASTMALSIPKRVWKGCLCTCAPSKGPR
eukprot:2256940-Alexandrium_andersonii.AAC.1